MPRVNVYLSESLHARAKRAKLNLSELCQGAIVAELDRRRRLRVLQQLASELEDRPLTKEEAADADAWVDEVLGTASPERPRSRRRAARKSA